MELKRVHLCYQIQKLYLIWREQGTAHLRALDGHNVNNDVLTVNRNVGIQ